MKRILLVLILAPLFALPGYLVPVFINQPSIPFSIESIVRFSIFILPISYATTLILGLPIYFFLRYFKLAHPLVIFLIGLPLGILPIIMINYIFSFSTGGLMYGAISGMSVSSVAAIILLKIKPKYYSYRAGKR